MAKTVFTEGNPGLSIPATVVHDAWLNAVQNHVHDGADLDGHCPPTVAQHNAIIDGCCRVGESPILTLVNNTWGYGKVNLIAGMASGTAVSAGTLTQATAAPVGRTGYAAQFAGVTITGAGVVSSRYRAESLDSLRFKNQSASFSCLVYNDVGANINYTVTVRKATVADNFAATTVIATGVAQAVTTATGTLVKLENIAMGDCSNGIEIEVRADCGAVTAKNFYITELGFYEGVVAQMYSWRPLTQEQLLCYRHLETVFYLVSAATAGTGYIQYKANYKAPKRAAPTLISYLDTVGNASKVSAINASGVAVPNIGAAVTADINGVNISLSSVSTYFGVAGSATVDCRL